MRKTTTLVLAVLTVAALSACGRQVVTGVAELASGAAAWPAPEDVLVKVPSGPRPTRPTIRLGEVPPPDWKSVGAPFDTCTTLKWEDFPPTTRDEEPRPPKLKVALRSDPYQTACEFQNHEPLPDPENPDRVSPDWNPIFTVTVMWGTELSPERLGGTPITLVGKPAAFKEEIRKSGAGVKFPACIVAIKLTNGFAGLELNNGRFRATLNTCETAKKLAETLASRVP